MKNHSLLLMILFFGKLMSSQINYIFESASLAETVLLSSSKCEFLHQNNSICSESLAFKQNDFFTELLERLVQPDAGYNYFADDWVKDYYKGLDSTLSKTLKNTDNWTTLDCKENQLLNLFTSGCNRNDKEDKNTSIKIKAILFNGNHAILVTGGSNLLFAGVYYKTDSKWRQLYGYNNIPVNEE